MAVTATTLSSLPSELLPDTVTGPIFERAMETSAVMQLARQVPLSMTSNTTIPVAMDVPVADWINEGDRKPVSSGGVEVKQMSGKKVAVLVPVSEEVARSNAAGLYQQLSQDLPVAIARAFDYAAIHGKRITDGSDGPFADHILSTDKSVDLGTASQANGGLWADIVSGEQLVTEDAWDFSGFVADPRLKPKLKLSVDSTGRPIFVDNLASGGLANGGTLDGYPIFYNRGVSGKLNRQSSTTDSLVRAIGGDWTQVAYGVGMNITVRTSTEATYVDADGTVHSAFQENLVLLLAEAYFGLVVGDTGAFVKYVEATGNGGE